MTNSLSPSSSNPYRVESASVISSERLARGKEVACVAAQKGLANGAILKKLRDLGIEGSIAEQIALEALTPRSRRRRIRGTLLFCSGVSLLCFGGSVLMLFGASAVFATQLPIGALMVGGLMSMLGIVDMFHRSLQRPRLIVALYR